MILPRIARAEQNPFLRQYRHPPSTVEAILELAGAKFEEADLPLFEEFFRFLLADVRTALWTHPSPHPESVPLAGRTIQDLRGETDFREGAVCYLRPRRGETLWLVGDLHGDWRAFEAIVRRTRLLEGNAEASSRIVFLGDYIDRGLRGLQVLVGIYLLKTLFPERILLLRGNHEQWHLAPDGTVASTVSGDNMFIEFWRDYLSPETLLDIRASFEAMPAVVLLEGGGMLVHGGIPRPQGTAPPFGFKADLSELTNPTAVEEMLWSDPEDKEMVLIVGDKRFAFARRHFVAFMDAIGARFLVRGHEPTLPGYRFLYNRRLVTLFSTGGRGNEDCYEGYRAVEPAMASLVDNKLSVHRVFGDGEVLDECDYSAEDGNAQA
jgi:hypothetical protein